MGALRPHYLEGLSEDDSWSLFKLSSFDEDYENDPRRESLGKEILKKCSGVPLAIRSIGSLLYSKSTVEEWAAIAREDISVLGRKYNDRAMSVLKLSYDHLPSHLKHCFAYCCLFPKDYEFSKRDLINHWSAQGYIDPNDDESGFLHLLRRGFFQEAKKGDCGEIESCKMHDLMHDLATYVAGDESIVSSSTSSYTSRYVRHVSFNNPYDDGPWDISTLELSAKLRSILLTRTYSNYTIESCELSQLFASVKLLRTLSLSFLFIKNIPPSIGELKLLRYLDLSRNDFKELPDSITYLVNLLSLNLEWCRNFEVWPIHFRKLTNLRYLNFLRCDKLRSMPMGIGEMTHLQYLGDFIAEKGNECLNTSARLLQQLRGKLSINCLNDVDEGICSWQLPVSLQRLEMRDYQGLRIPGWENRGSTINLTRLRLFNCTKVKCLPLLRCLPNLRWLEVRELLELEFMEEGGCIDDKNASSKFFFTCLEELLLYELPKLKRCWGAFAEFPRLCDLEVYECPKLEFNSLPLYPHVQIQSLRFTSYGTTSLTHGKLPSTSSLSSPIPPEITISRCKWQSSLASLQELVIENCCTLNSLNMASPLLQRMLLWKLQNSHLSHPNALEQLTISSWESMDWDSISNLGECSCIREIYLHGGVGVAFIQRIISSSASSLTVISIKGLFDDDTASFLKGINWDSIPNLQNLILCPLPPLEEFPECLVKRQARGQLRISEYDIEQHEIA